MKPDIEPRGFCPYCEVTGWRICQHFAGYVRGGMVVDDSGKGRPGKGNMRPKRADEVAVDTGVSVRAYRKTGVSR